VPWSKCRHRTERVCALRLLRRPTHDGSPFPGDIPPGAGEAGPLALEARRLGLTEVAQPVPGRGVRLVAEVQAQLVAELTALRHPLARKGSARR
jgi:hypothetical protein